MATRQVSRLRFALSATDRVRLLPFLAEYKQETGVAVIPVTFGDLYRALSVELTRRICSFELVSIDDPWVAVFAGGRFLMSLDELGADARQPLDVSDFLPSFLALGMAPNSTELFALPWIGNIQLYGYQARLFAELGLAVPASWADIVFASAMITEERSPTTYGVGLRGRPGHGAASTFLPILRGHGVELFDASWEPQLETAAAAAAMATLLKLAPHAPLDVSETGQEELTVQIENGRVAQSADIWPTQLLGWSGQRMRLPITSISLGQIPDSTETETRAVTGNWLLGIPAACSATAPAALEFMRWLTSPRQQLRLLLETGLPPTRISVMNDQSAAAKQPLLSQIAMVAAQATPRPRTHYYPAVEQIVGTWVAGAMAGLVSGEQALTSANRELTSVMQHRPAGAS